VPAPVILLLLDGSFAVVLLHRDPSDMETAGQAAHALTKTRFALLPGHVEKGDSYNERRSKLPRVRSISVTSPCPAP
jgi:hypothetical protein